MSSHAHLLSNRINSLAESQTLAMTKKAREIAAQGHKVINLSIGEPDFPTPQHIKDAAKKAIDDNFSFYAPVPGFPELRTAIAEKLKRDNDLDWKAENIIVSTGAKQSLANALLCLVNPGDEVIIYSPYWVSYSELVKLAEGIPVLIKGKIENNFVATIDQLKAAINPKTKVIMFSSPSNPTGGMFTEEQLREIASEVAQHPNVFILADEIYEYITFGNKKFFSIGSIPEIKEQVITINGFSKGFAMTGWRLGYTASAKWIADAMDKLQGQVTSGANSVAMKAATVALNSPLDEAHKMAAAYKRRRDLVVGLVNNIPGFRCPTPDGAFYVFPDISYYFSKTDGTYLIKTAEDFCMYLLNTAYVSLVTGEAFGEPNCIRLSYAASDEALVEALDRVKVACAKLQ
jgi:aspartate aminotransferase